MSRGVRTGLADLYCSVFHVKHSLPGTDGGAMMFHVKPKHDIPSAERVADALTEARVKVTSVRVHQLVQHAELVLRANERLNLTRIIGADDVTNLHIVDSLAFLPLVPPMSEPVLDLGAGAGYPGIPLAIMGLDVVLCESIQKKASFLQETVDTLDLPVRVVAARAEELAAQEPASYGTVVARAVAGIGPLLELAAPLLQDGGALVALKGRPAEEELSRACRVAALTGFEPIMQQEYELPRGEQRCVLIYRKTRPAKVVLPRRPGLAQRQPLGGT